jgi:hypothetical protein
VLAFKFGCMDAIPLREKERKPLTQVPQFELHVHERAIQISELNMYYGQLFCQCALSIIHCGAGK